MPERRKVFISYSRKDRRHLDDLRSHLAPLEHEYGLDVWDDSKIGVGTQWKAEIARALDDAKVGVLLVSPPFLASEFVRKVELQGLLEAARQDGLRLCVVHLRHSTIHLLAQLSSIQAINDPGHPIVSLRGAARDNAWAKVASGILELASTHSDVAPDKREEGVAALNRASERVGSYLVALINLDYAFQTTHRVMFETDDEYADFQKVIGAYNEAINDLQARKHEYVYGLASFTSPARVDEWKSLFDEIDVDVHGDHVFRLNEIGMRMNRMLRGLVPAPELDAYRRETFERLGEQLRMLAKKIPALRQRVEVLYKRTLAEL